MNSGQTRKEPGLEIADGDCGESDNRRAKGGLSLSKPLPWHSSSIYNMDGDDNDDITGERFPFRNSLRRQCFLLDAMLIILLLAATYMSTMVWTTKGNGSSSDLLLIREELAQNIPFFHQSFRRVLQNGTDLDDLDDSNTTNLPTINITLGPGQDASNVSIVLDEVETTINATSNATSPTMTPTAIAFSPTINSTITNEPMLSPTTATQSPTVSPTPGNTTLSPSQLRTDFPTVAPTTVLPTISSMPTISPVPTSAPTISLPTMMPTTEKKIGEVNIIMILKNVPGKINESDVSEWENVTSKHLVDFYATVSETYPNDWNINITRVNTNFLSQEFEAVDENDQDLLFFGEPPPAQSPTKIPAGETLSPTTSKTNMLSITYDQTVFYEADETDVTESEIRNMLFILPFKADSFQYSVNLTKALDWGNWIIVDDVQAGERKTEPTPAAPTGDFRLTQTQTIAISISIVLSALLIVFFLLWERNHKVEGGHRGSNHSSNHSSIGMPSTEFGGTNMGTGEWDREHVKNAYDGEVNSHEEPGVLSSIRSAPAHLRRGERYSYSHHYKTQNPQEEITRERLPSTDGVLEPEESGQKKDRSSHGRESTGHSRGKNSRSRSSTNSSGKEDETPKSEEIFSIASPSIPKQVPITLHGRSISSTSDRSTSSNRGLYPPIPALPPLPPTTPYGNISTSQGNVSIATTINTNDSNAPVNHPSSGHFQRSVNGRGARRPFNMRVSDISDDSDFSFISEALRQEREETGMISNEFPRPIPDEHLQHLGENPVKYLPPDAFQSPLHIPDEEAMDIDAYRAAPDSPVSGILGLSPMADRMLISPSQDGFQMKVQDLDEQSQNNIFANDYA